MPKDELQLTLPTFPNPSARVHGGGADGPGQPASVCAARPGAQVFLSEAKEALAEGERAVMAARPPDRCGAASLRRSRPSGGTWKRLRQSTRTNWCSTGRTPCWRHP